VLRTPECGAELSLPTADLFGCALIRTSEQIRWSESRRGLQACSLSPLRLRSAPHYIFKKGSLWLNEFRLIGSGSESSILSVFVFSMVQILLIVLKMADKRLSDQFDSRKEMVPMKKTGLLRSLFISSVQYIWAVGVGITAGALSA
jgi:hypothetical protein